MRVVARMRRIDANGAPVEPVELDQVEAEADTYEAARDAAVAKVPDGWQLLDWMVPDHWPDQK